MGHFTLIEAKRQNYLTQSPLSLPANKVLHRGFISKVKANEEKDSRISFNVSGHIYETFKSTLSKYPSTLLGEESSRRKMIDQQNGQIFLNRNHSSFEAILYFYQSSGNLVRPATVMMSHFEKECRFYKLPEDAIKRMKQRESFLHRKKVESQRHIHNRFIYNCWIFIERPKEFFLPWLSKLYFCFFYGMVLFSIGLFCLETEIPLHHSSGKILNQFEMIHMYCEIGVNFFFVMEFLIRFTVSQNQRYFFKQPTNFLELISLLIFIVFVGTTKTEHRRSILFVSRTFYIFRLTRLGRISKVIKTSVTVFLESVDDVIAVLFTMLIIVVFGGTVMYYFESGDPGTKFLSIPDSMWWAVQTSLCLGYGDIVPQTMNGRYLGMLVLYGGVVVIMILILSLGGRVFDMYIKEFDENSGGFLPDLNGKKDYEIHYKDDDEKRDNLLSR